LAAQALRASSELLGYSIEWQLNSLAESEKAISGGDMGESPLLAEFDRVTTDHVGGAEQLVQSLARAGSKRILRL